MSIFICLALIVPICTLHGETPESNFDKYKGILYKIQVINKVLS